MELKCSLDLRVLAIIRTFITSLAGEMGFAEDKVGEIEMAVDEACANVIRHAYKHLGVSPDLDQDLTPPPGEEFILLLRLSLAPHMLRIQVVDNGIGKNRMKGGVQSIEEYTARGSTGGLGTLIIQNFMDEVDYDYPDGRGTVLTMTKYLQNPAS
jgi:serine/threonine-protein kinase RsbW